MVKTLRFHRREHGFHPWSGTKILHAARRSQKKKKELFTVSTRAIWLSQNIGCIGKIR